MNYTGASCSICGQTFTDTDDVVVCPECGTPYHRACYKEVGHCTATELHETGGEWVNPVKKELKPEVKKDTQYPVWTCPRCGLVQSTDYPICEQCDCPQSMVRRDQTEEERPAAEEKRQYDPYEDPFMDPYTASFAPIDMNSTIQSVPVKDLMAFTRKNAQYFVRMFKLMAANIGARVFNWSALLFGPFYFLYRKMHHKGLILLMILLASNLPSFAIAYRLMPQVLADPSLLETFAFNTDGMDFIMTLSNIAGYIPFVLHIYCGFTANMSYFQHTMESMKQLNKECAGDRSRLEALILRRGGVSLGSVILAMVFSAVLFLAISTVIVMKFI